jgi:hypothetical protein
MANQPTFTTTIKTASSSTTAATAWTVSGSTTTNLVSLLTASGNGCRVTSMIFSTTDSAAVNAFIVLNGNGGAGTLSVVGQVNIPLTSGTVASVLAVDGLNPSVTVGLPIDNNGKRFIHMETGDVLYIGVVATMTSGKILQATVMYEQY